MGGNGDPEAKSTRPSVCSTASWKEHSESLTGLERGKIIGRGLSAAIAWITAVLNEPWPWEYYKRDEKKNISIRTGIVESPSRAVGLT